MLIGFVLAILFFGVLVAVLGLLAPEHRRGKLPGIVLGGYVLRLIIQFFIRDVQLFSHAAGGDSQLYEAYGRLISLMWRERGFEFITAHDFPQIGATSLPPNLFALIIHLNDGEPARLGCTALVAVAAALTAINLYSLCVELGASRERALLFATIIYFEPGFLFYTSDMYKDGLVVCFAFGALASAIRLSSKLTPLHVVLGVLCAFALWFVRYYLVFVTVAPMLVGAIGVGSKNIARPVIAAVTLATAVVALAAFTDILQMATQRAEETYDVGTSTRVIMANANKGGSGVVFDDGGVPYRALPQKLAYTLFSPFPWAGGSIGFHIGKLDVFLWYFIIYRAVRAARQVDRRVALMFATFVLPTTVMYAMTVSNVGLILRQRLIIVVVTAVLASLYVPKERARVARARPARRVQRARLAA